jgi:hypothetical protein
VAEWIMSIKKMSVTSLGIPPATFGLNEAHKVLSGVFFSGLLIDLKSVFLTASHKMHKKEQGLQF